MIPAKTWVRVRLPKPPRPGSGHPGAARTRAPAAPDAKPAAKAVEPPPPGIELPLPAAGRSSRSGCSTVTARRSSTRRQRQAVRQGLPGHASPSVRLRQRAGPDDHPERARRSPGRDRQAKALRLSRKRARSAFFPAARRALRPRTPRGILSPHADHRHQQGLEGELGHGLRAALKIPARDSASTSASTASTAPSGTTSTCSVRPRRRRSCQRHQSRGAGLAGHSEDRHRPGRGLPGPRRGG